MKIFMKYVKLSRKMHNASFSNRKTSILAVIPTSESEEKDFCDIPPIPCRSKTKSFPQVIKYGDSMEGLEFLCFFCCFGK